MSITCVICIDTHPADIYPLSLHDALPILDGDLARRVPARMVSVDVEVDDRPRLSKAAVNGRRRRRPWTGAGDRSEEHTSELQSHSDLVCRLLLEKKKEKILNAYLRSAQQS